MSESEFSGPKQLQSAAVPRHECVASQAGQTCMDVTHGIEKFTAKDLASLRGDLLRSGVDSFQAAEIVTAFLGGRGYGISTDEARQVAAKIEGPGCTLECIEAELGRVARVA